MQSGGPKPIPDNKTDSTYLTTFYSFFQKTTEKPNAETPIVSESSKISGREKSDFKDNITASLKLPKKPKKQLDCKKDEAFLTQLVNSVSALLFQPKPPTVIQEQKQEKPEDEKKNGIRAKITVLEKQRQALGVNPKAEDVDNLLLQEVELLEHQIREHAARRVDLFFYLLIAVYNTHVTIAKGATDKQHGRGNKDLGTNACHSSLFPGVKLTPPPVTLLSNLLSSIPPSLVGTHYEDALNMTMELPRCVNDFDGHLEGRHGHTRYVEFCEDVLNSAAKGEIDPIHAMNRFFRHINAFFVHYKKEYICLYDLALMSELVKPEKEVFYVRMKDGALEYMVINKGQKIQDKIEKKDLETILTLDELAALNLEPLDLKKIDPFLPKIIKVTSKRGHTREKITETPKTNERIWQYQREGTFQAANIDLTMKHEYLCMMLRLNPHEIRTSYVPLLSSALLAVKYRQRQNELLTEKPVEPMPSKPSKPRRKL